MGIRKVIANVVGLSSCVAVAYGLYGTMRGIDCSPTASSCTSSDAGGTFLIAGGIIVAIFSVIAGAPLVFPLLFGAVGVGSLLAGFQSHEQTTFLLVFGGIFTAVSVLLMAGMLFVRSTGKKTAAESERLMQTGIPAVGTILSLRETGASVNDHPWVRLRVRIEPTNGMPSYEGEKSVLMSLVRPIQVGQRFPVVIDPADTSKFLLLTDTSDPSKLPPHLSELLPLVKIGSPLVAPAGDLAGQLTKLDELRRSGALSDQEFAAAKARLLSS